MREYNYTRATSSSTSRSSSSSCFGTSAGLEVIRDFLGCIAGILYNSLARGSARLLQLGTVHDRSKRKCRFMSPTFQKQASSTSSEYSDEGFVDRDGMKTSGKRLSQQRSWKMTAATVSSWTSEIDHDREWEIRKDVLARSTSSVSAASAAAAVVKKKKQIVGRCVSDCTGMRNKSNESCSEREVVRTRSLTDADLDELRGCIDLGFGFKNEADPELWETLPALELCYAISQQFKEVHGSPASSFIGADGSSETSSEDTGSLIASPSSWQIASPGDQQVKTRLRHWARAVACTVRQSL